MASSKSDFASKYAFAFESSSDDDDAGGLVAIKTAALTQPVVQDERKEEAQPNRGEVVAGLKSYFAYEDDENDKGVEG
jgi:hypothetical protein